MGTDTTRNGNEVDSRVTLTEAADRVPGAPRKVVKVASLIIHTLQNAITTVSLRHSRSRKSKEDLFISSTAVFLGEVIKLWASLSLVYVTEASNPIHFFHLLYSSIIKQPLDTLKVCVPAILYVIQNNLLYIASTNLDAATLQVTYQLKILTIAFFAVLLLRKSLTSIQWLSLLILMSGIALVQISDTKEATAANKHQNRLLGFGVVLLACVFSGFSGVYLEKILKNTEASLWIRNVQLALISLPASMGTVLISDWRNLHERGFFFGYDYFVIFVIMMQSLGGLLVGVVIKYADNILKGFATSLAIILSSLLSLYFFNLRWNWKFVLGVMLVIISVFMYNVPKRSNETPENRLPMRDLSKILT